MSADIMQNLMQYDMMQKYMPSFESEKMDVKEVMAYKPNIAGIMS